MKGRLSLLACALVGAGCSLLKPPPLPTFETAVLVEGDPGDPVQGVELTYKGNRVGVTDDMGRLNLRLKGAEGEVFPLLVKCPSGYKSPPKPLSIVLRKIADKDAKAEYRATCTPAERTVVIAVRADNGPNLPVMHLGREVARTDESGAAHVKLKAEPHQSLKLKLDTSENTALKPKNPERVFEVKNQDDLFVFDQTFNVERKRRYYRTRRTSSGPTPL